ALFASLILPPVCAAQGLLKRNQDLINKPSEQRPVNQPREDEEPVGPVEGEFVPLGFLPGDAGGSRALAISADGRTVVGTWSTAKGSQAFVWNIADGMRELADRTHFRRPMVATCVNRNGTIVGGVGEEGQSGTPCVWVNGAARDIVLTRGTSSQQV